MLNTKYLDELEEYMTSGRMEDEFEYSPEERRHELLAFLERVMDIADIADETATRLIFKNSQFGAMMGLKDQK